MASRVKLWGQVFRALSSKAEKGQIEIHASKATIEIEGTVVFEAVEIASIQGKKDIFLKNNVLFSLDKPLSSEQEKLCFNRASRGLHWLEQFSLIKALALAVILIGSVIGLRYGLTAITPVVVSIVPQGIEEAIGDAAYRALKRTTFTETTLSSDQVARLQAKSQQLAAANNINYPMVLFYKSEQLGANALAFPGGPIVVTDDLVTLLQRDELVVAVIAHELAHVERQHSLHQIVEILGIIAITSLVLGADDTVIEELSAIGISLWASKKSRDFEKEADLYAVKYLETAGLDKRAFPNALEALTEHFCSSRRVPSQEKEDCLNETESGWFSSHPAGAERLRYLADE